MALVGVIEYHTSGPTPAQQLLVPSGIEPVLVPTTVVVPEVRIIGMALTQASLMGCAREVEDRRVRRAAAPKCRRKFLETLSTNVPG